MKIEIDWKIFPLSWMFLILAIMHLIFLTQTYPYFTLDDRSVVSCAGDNELLIYFNGEFNTLNISNSPLCISNEIGNRLQEQVIDLNKNNKIINWIAIGGYSLSFLISFLSSLRYRKD